MLSQPESACLLIADITGYTAFLAGAELDHAQDILADLMTTAVNRLRPAFRLAKLEGDAAFAWAPRGRVDGPRLLDIVESTYVAFQRRLRDVRQATSCSCNACRNMPNLDLKIVVHAGPVIRQRIAGRQELLGSAVVVVHRLLKNRVVETTGILAYALITADCAAMVGLDAGELGSIRVVEDVADVGLVEAWVHDLGATWRAEQDRPRLTLPASAPLRKELAQPAPQAVVWDYLTDPAKRPLWSVGMDEVRPLDGTPRRGPGAMNHCVHGKDVLIEEILDWRPPDFLASRTAIPGMGQIVMTIELRPAAGGTAGTIAVGFGASGTDPAPAEAVGMIGGIIDAGQARLAALLEAEMARTADQAAAPEAALPSSAGRQFSDPIAAG